MMNFFETIPIIYYSIYLVIAIYIIGYGFTAVALPAKLHRHTFVLTPWFTLSAITLLLTILSMAGIPVRLGTWFILPPLLLLSGLTLSRAKLAIFPINWKAVAIMAFVFGCIAIQLMPLLRRDRILTSISLGNNDVIVYANTPDYLEDHTIFEGYTYLPTELKPSEKGVANLLHDGFRWGSPILASFLQVITGLEGYQMAYLHLVILYSLLIPLAYLLFRLLYRSSWIGIIIIGCAFLFNANMLYMLYHAFAGQVIFWGLFLLLLIYFVSYFNDDHKPTRLTYFECIIALTIATLYYSYHEGILFVLAPAILFGVFKLVTGTFVSYILTWSRIGLIVLLTASHAVVNATVFDFFQASLVDAPIGWELFRAKEPFVNLFEMAGMHSLHTSGPMFGMTGIPASLAVAGIFLSGFLRSRMRLLLICYVFLFVSMLIWSSILHDNFFIYNRIVTYMLPLLLVIFAIGIDRVFETKKLLGTSLVILFVALNCYAGMAIVTKFMNNHLSVDRSLISLKELEAETSIKETIYLDQVVLSQMYYWRMIWLEYFLYPNKDVVSFSNYEEKNQIQDGNLLLVQTSHFTYPPPKVILDPVVWENGYYKVGRLCVSDECVAKKNIPLSEVIMGQSEYEDAMLVSGWGVNEGEHRWGIEKKALARFVVPPEGANYMEIEARSLQEPQSVSIQVGDVVVGELNVKKDWGVYTVLLPPSLEPGVHRVTFTFTQGYRPSEVLGNADTRELYVDFRRISLK